KDKRPVDNIPGVVDQLPNGRLKHWASKLTNLDIGMISNYHSDYTLAGQMSKGVAVGYDFDVFELGANIGATDYITPDGTVLKYRTGLGSVKTPIGKHSGLLMSYFTYAPYGSTQVTSVHGVGDIGQHAFSDRTDIYS